MITYNMALGIQDKQFDHYKQGLSQATAFKLGNKLVRETWTPDDTNVDYNWSLDNFMSDRILFSLVPRGGWFEYAENIAIMHHGKSFFHPFRAIK